MCGIIGILGDGPVAADMVEALRRLEYRGYDSAGVCILEDGRFDRLRAPGKLHNLGALVIKAEPQGPAGIGHTRWATHGAANETNAHPHIAGKVSIVHNGIIENFRDLREDLAAAGRTFSTETDSEVIAHLLDAGLEAGLSPAEAMSAAVGKMRGAFAIAAIISDQPDLLLAARKGSPLAIGVGEGSMYVGSDALALAPFTNRVIFLEDGDWAVVTRSGADVYDAADQKIDRPVNVVPVVGGATEKGNHRHFMQKEIYEQPDFIGRTISAYVNAFENTIRLPEDATAKLDFTKIDRVQIVACGTAYYAGLVARYWFEQIAGVAADADIASEFRYREPVLGPNTLAVFVTQSGETADTRAALDYCRKKGVLTAAVVNVPSSTIAREADIVLPTLAGVEIGVASTKAFTAQLCTLLSTAIAAARQRGAITPDEEAAHVGAMLELPRLVAEAQKTEPAIEAIAVELAKARDVLYLGRGQHFPIALEGALKLKEVSYIHAEGYASGELKHGPIALIDEETPVVMTAPHDDLFEKSLSNLEEVAARHGRVLLISDAPGLRKAADAPWATIEIPECAEAIQPIVAVIPLQLLAYHVAVEKGTDVDQPRNLAKSVTVE